MIYLDMSKAFDMVSQTILASKLRQFNINGNTLNWFKAYLHCRQQRVTLLGATFFCPDSYQDHLARNSLLPICYWHEYLDLVFFFKALNGLIEKDQDILPKPLVPSRSMWSTSNPNAFKNLLLMANCFILD